jgi:hypothetical protein
MARVAKKPPRRPGWLATGGIVVVVLLAGWAITSITQADDGGPPSTQARAQAVATATTLPAACADALAIADALAPHALRLADAAVDHVVIMDRLDLFLEGKPGGLNGEQVYRLGDKQMKVMEADAPDAQVRAKRYREVRKRCPLK